jgi:hypothetical protein
LATRRRNLIAVIVRWSLFAVIERLQHLFEKRYGSDSPATIVATPMVRHRDQLRELMSRAQWYLPDANAPVSIPCNRKLLNWVSGSEISETTGGGAARVRLFSAAEANRSTGQQLLVWRWPHCFLLLGRRAPFTIVDPWFYSTVESVAWARLNYRFMPQAKRDALRHLSQDNFARCLHRWAGAQQAFVFATGPSLEHATSIDIGECDVRIVCNSIVRNAQLLSHIRPSILVFADPVFHFGPSRYAATFRDHAVAAIARHDCFCVVPEAQMGLLLAHFPQVEHRLIGMPLRRKSAWNFPSEDRFYVRDTGNILTTLMLPLASALARQVPILGADGRARGERYFWRHSTQSQFGELMNSAVEAHPSFFRDRIYARYYRTHCRELEHQLAYGERKGVRYLAVTPSHIPALAARVTS